MAYQCLDCTHRAGNFPGGLCSACGSANVRRIGRRAIEMRATARKPYRLVLCAVLWLVFLHEGWRLLTA